MIASVSMEYFWCYLWRQSKMKKKKKGNISASSSASDICEYQTGIQAWYHHSRRWAFQQMKHSWLCDWVLHWWSCFVSIAFLLLTWIQELKAGCLYVLCPNITDPCTLSPALVRNVACLKSSELNVVLRRVKGMWGEQTETKGRDMLTRGWHHRWEKKKRGLRVRRGESKVTYETKVRGNGKPQFCKTKENRITLLFRKDNITLRDWQSPFNQITNCNKLPAGRHHHKSKPAALLGNWLQIFHCCFAKSRSFSGQSPLKRPCPQILELQKFPNT